MKKFVWTLVLIAVLGCANDKPYEPEGLNAMALRPQPESYQINHLTVLFECTSDPRTVIVHLDVTFSNGFVPCTANSQGVRFWRTGSSPTNCLSNITQWFAWEGITNLGGGRFVFARTIPRSSLSGWTVDSYISAEFSVEGAIPNCAQDECTPGPNCREYAAILRECEWQVPCVGVPGGGGGGFEGAPPINPDGKISAHRFACPAYDGSGACVCDASEVMQEWADWALDDLLILP